VNDLLTNIKNIEQSNTPIDPDNIKVHPLADMLPMLPDDKFTDLVASIKKNGLFYEIVLGDVDGVEMLLDGRNRLKACKVAEIEPRFRKLDGQDPLDFILEIANARRDLTLGQRVIFAARAEPYRQQGKRTCPDSDKSFGVSKQRLSEGRLICDHAPALADLLMQNSMTLNEATVKARKIKALADEEKEKMVRLRAEAPDLADLTGISLDDAIVKLDQRKAEAARLKTIEDAPDLVRLVQEARLSVDEALAAYEKRNSERFNLQKSATDFLARVVALIGVGERSPKEMANRIMEDFNPRMWPQEQLDDLNAHTFKACGEMLIECAKIIKLKE
jgi:hypothetical protein